MSYYTNDTDTLRQFISQALPQLILAVISIVVILASMLASSVPLTLVVLAFTALMVYSTKVVGGQQCPLLCPSADKPRKYHRIY